MRLHPMGGERDEDGGGTTVQERGQPVAPPAGAGVARWDMRTKRWPSLAGIIGPIMFTGAVASGSALRPGFNSVTQFVSELGAGPHGWIYNDAVVAFGALELPFVLQLTATLRSTPSSRTARRLLVTFSVATIVLGLVPTRQRVVVNDASFLHVLAFVVGIASLIIACALLAPRFAEVMRWRQMAAPSYLAALLGAALLVAPLALGPVRWYALAGLIQRLLMAVLLMWLEVTAILLFALSVTEPGVLDSVPRNSIGR